MGKDHIGVKIRQRRQELGLKVYELAEKVGVNPVYITQIERHGKLPSSEVFLKIEEALNFHSEIRDQYLFNKYLEAVGGELFTPPIQKTYAMELLEQLVRINGEENILKSYERIIGNHPDAPMLLKKLKLVIKKYKEAINESESFYKIMKKNFGNKGKPLETT